MLYAAIDIHKHVFQAVVLDGESGQFCEARFSAEREQLHDWAMLWRGKVACVGIEATTGWRWVARELDRLGLEVRLIDPGQASALQGRRRSPKTDRLDARWLVGLLADQRAPVAWRAPEEIQQLRDTTRLRKALVEERTAWAQRLHALLLQEGCARAKSKLLTGQGRRALGGLALSPSAHAYVERALRLIEAIEAELDPLEAELTRFANGDRRCKALMTIYGVGPIIACHLLAELGQAARFRQSRSVIRLAGLDPVVRDSGERRRRGRLSKVGSPALRFALVHAAQHAHRAGNPEYRRYLRLRQRIGANRAKLVIARRIGLQAYRLLLTAEAAA